MDHTLEHCIDKYMLNRRLIFLYNNLAIFSTFLSHPIGVRWRNHGSVVKMMNCQPRDRVWWDI